MARLADRVGIAAALAFATILTAVLAVVTLLVGRRSLDGIVDSARQRPGSGSAASRAGLALLALGAALSLRST